jgi:zinc transport system ATP-binding protein
LTEPQPSSPQPPQPHACATHGCDHGSLDKHSQADLVCLDRVTYTYPSGTPALQDVTLHVDRGCNLGIIGPNGAGKSTLIKILLGVLTGYSGSVTLAGLSPAEACRRGDVVGYVPQRFDVEWRFPVHAEQVVCMGLVGKTGMFRRLASSDRKYARHIMQRVGIADLAHRPIGDLSGGQQQRVFIARALVCRPQILILDEPTVGVDEGGRKRFAELIHDLHESLNLTVIIVSHDLAAIAAGCNRIACLNRTIHYHDAPAGLTREVLAEVFRHDIAPFVPQQAGA